MIRVGAASVGQSDRSSPKYVSQISLPGNQMFRSHSLVAECEMFLQEKLLLRNRDPALTA